LLVLLILFLESVVGFVVQIKILKTLAFQIFDLSVLFGEILVSLFDLFIMGDFLSLVLDLVVFKLLNFMLLIHGLFLILV